MCNYCWWLINRYCLICVIGKFDSFEKITDDYGHSVSTGEKYMLGHFLEQVHDPITRKKSKLMPKKNSVFYRENIVHPFVNMSEINGHYIISCRDFKDIANYVEHYWLAALWTASTIILHFIIASHGSFVNIRFSEQLKKFLKLICSYYSDKPQSSLKLMFIHQSCIKINSRYFAITCITFYHNFI